MFLTYNIFIHLLFPFILIFLIFKKKISFKHIIERFGFYRLKKGNYIWFHGASVGEVNLALKLINGLKKNISNYKILLTTNTVTARNVALNSTDVDYVMYFPFDLLFCVFLALSKVRPKLVVIFETEFWFNFLTVANLFGVKSMLVNGRISDVKYGYYIFLKCLFSRVVKKFHLCLMRSKEDEKKMIDIGCIRSKVISIGDMKFDVAIGEKIHPEDVYAEYGFNERDLILTAGSVHANEDKIIIEIFRDLKYTFKELRLIIAPRYMNRVGFIESMLASAEMRFRRKSEPINYDVDCIILDTYGELLKAYSIASVVFVGGSLVKHGGHNLIEPLTFWKYVLFGPHVDNFREHADFIIKNNFGRCVKDGCELKEAIYEALSNPEQLILLSEKMKRVLASAGNVTKKYIGYICEALQ